MKTNDILKEYVKLMKSNSCLNINSNNINDQIKIDRSKSYIMLKCNEIGMTSLSKYKLDRKEFLRTFSKLSFKHSPVNDENEKPHLKLNFTKKIEEKIKRRRSAMIKSSTDFTKDEKIRFNRLSFGEKNALEKPLIDLEKNHLDHGTLNKKLNQMKNNLDNLQFNKKIYDDNEINLSITDKCEEEVYNNNHDQEIKDMILLKQEDITGNQGNLMVKIRKPIKQALANLNNLKYDLNIENKINFRQDNLTYPTIKNRIFYNNSSNLKRINEYKIINKIEKQLIIPNNFDKKINLQVNTLKRQLIENKDYLNLKNKLLTIKNKDKIIYTYKNIENNLSQKIENVKLFYDSHKYLSDKCSNYCPKVIPCKGLVKSFIKKCKVSKEI